MQIRIGISVRENSLRAEAMAVVAVIGSSLVAAGFAGHQCIGNASGGSPDGDPRQPLHSVWESDFQ
jgi:hypothetical protein